MEAILQGTYRHPQILVHFGWGETLPSGRPVQDWVRRLPGRVYDRSSKTSTVSGLGARTRRRSSNAPSSISTTAASAPTPTYAAGCWPNSSTRSATDSAFLLSLLATATGAAILARLLYRATRKDPRGH